MLSACSDRIATDPSNKFVHILDFVNALKLHKAKQTKHLQCHKKQLEPSVNGTELKRMRNEKDIKADIHIDCSSAAKQTKHFQCHKKQLEPSVSGTELKRMRNEKDMKAGIHVDCSLVAAALPSAGPSEIVNSCLENVHCIPDNSEDEVMAVDVAEVVNVNADHNEIPHSIEPDDLKPNMTTTNDRRTMQPHENGVQDGKTDCEMPSCSQNEETASSPSRQRSERHIRRLEKLLLVRIICS